MAVSKKPVPRTVRKAKPTDGDWVAVFNKAGQLVGICPADKITPVSDSGDDTAMKALPVPARSANTVAAAGEEPQMGVAKRARRTSPTPRASTPEDRQQRAAQLRKGLSGPGLAADGDKLAKEMGEAAQRVLKQIHGGGRAA